jgi:hypothetical protein
VPKKSTEAVAASSPTWETLETFARLGAQELLQRALKAEVDELLARCRYARRAAVDAPAGYWIVDEIETAGCVPKLVHARKAKLMMGQINKTDRLDARGLNLLQRG